MPDGDCGRRMRQDWIKSGGSGLRMRVEVEVEVEIHLVFLA
jgi:hypothetical protein